MKRPTQVDVARLAGVSRATVSYVLNRQAKNRVPISEETRQRVLDAVAELGYEPDARAQSLRSGSTKTIGLLIPDLQNPHFWQIINGASQEARQAGYDVLLTSSDLDRQQEEKALKSLSQRRIDGLILLTAFTTLSADLLTETAVRRLPIVMIGGHQEAQFDCVGSNYEVGTVDVMTHLHGLGHERIAFIHGVANERSALDRLRPYRNYLQQNNLPFDETFIAHCGATPDDAREAAKQLLTGPTPPTAIIVVNDLLASGVVRAAADLGLTIPNDFSLVGFDDIPAARYMTPSLTSVRTDAEAIGRGAVGLLLQRLGDRERPLQAIHIPTKLMVRESTGPVPR